MLIKYTKFTKTKGVEGLLRNVKFNIFQLILVFLFLFHGIIAIFNSQDQLIYFVLASLIYVSLFTLITTYRVSSTFLKKRLSRFLFSIVMGVISFYASISIYFVILGLYIAKTS